MARILFSTSYSQLRAPRHIDRVVRSAGERKAPGLSRQGCDSPVQWWRREAQLRVYFDDLDLRPQREWGHKPWHWWALFLCDHC
jgi:hypothetical protein